MKVALSRGHYPARPGATFGGYNEHELVSWYLNYVISSPIKESIKRYLVPVGRLQDKVKFINENDFDLAIELHFNSCNGCDATGSETLYYPGSEIGMKCARIIQDHISIVFEPDRGIKEGWYRMDRPGVEDYEGDVDGNEVIDYFLRKTRCPALIVEPEFIHRISKIRSKCEEFAIEFNKALEEIYQKQIIQ